MEHLKTQTEWRNLHAEILAETDPAKQTELRRIAGNTAEYFVVSVSGVAETGELVSGDLTGTRVGPLTHSAGKIVIVVGSNKIVPTLDDALNRIRKFALPVESARVRVAYKVPASHLTNLGKGIALFHPSHGPLTLSSLTRSCS